MHHWYGLNVNVKDVRDLHAAVLVTAGDALCKAQLELIQDNGTGTGGVDDEGTTVLITAAFSGDKRKSGQVVSNASDFCWIGAET